MRITNESCALLRNYKDWFEGKLCRSAISEESEPFRRVKSVLWHGPPSGFYGHLELIYEDDTSEYIIAPRQTNDSRTRDTTPYRPRKKDVEILKEN